MKIAIVLAVILVVFLVVVALQPSQFHIARSTTIAAAPAEIFPRINDLRRTHEWSPWMKLDPAAKIAFEGPAAGVGASSTWAGNSKMGEGRQTIVESRAGEAVKTRLDFVKPFKSTALAEVTLKPDGARTLVTWSLSGENNFISKAFCLFMNQDKMIGTPFEEGLAMLKTQVEARPAK